MTDGDKLLQRMLVQNAVNSVSKIVGNKSSKVSSKPDIGLCSLRGRVGSLWFGPLLGYVEVFYYAFCFRRKELRTRVCCFNGYRNINSLEIKGGMAGNPEPKTRPDRRIRSLLWPKYVGEKIQDV